MFTRTISLFTTQVYSSLYFRNKLVIDIITTLFRVLLLLVIYTNIYKVAPSVSAILPYESALWSLGGYFILMSLNIRRMFRRLSELIYSGNIETYLIRPVNFLWMLAVQIVADHLVQFLVTVIVVATFLVSTVGVPEIVFSPILIIGALTLAVVGVVIELLLATLVGLFAIWLEKAEPVWWIIDKFILILGGSYVPIAFFPEFLQFVAKNSPFGATRFFSLIFYPHAELLLGNYLIVQSVWVGVLLLSIIIVLRRGLHKLFINGS